MINYAAWKILVIAMTIFCAVNAYSVTKKKSVLAIKSNYDDHGLDGYLLSTDLQSGLLIPPKPLSNVELRTLIVDSKWKNKYCKVNIDYSLLNIGTWNGHYCLEKVNEGPDKGKYKNLCCGGKTCACSWSSTLGDPFNCDCKEPKVIQ